MYLAALTERIRRAGLPNLPMPLALDVTADSSPGQTFDGIFSANTLHIMSWKVVETFFSRLSQLTCDSAVLCIYGPFNYNGQFSSASNAAFDASLKSRDPLMGIRDIEQVLALAQLQGFSLQQDCAMPANNRLLWFIKNV